MCWKGAQGLELDLGLSSNGSGMLTKPLPLQRLISSFMKGEWRYLSYSQELTEIINAMNMVCIYQFSKVKSWLRNVWFLWWNSLTPGGALEPLIRWGQTSREKQLLYGDCVKYFKKTASLQGGETAVCINIYAEYDLQALFKSSASSQWKH